jgi:hypothetical protein
MTEGCWEKEGMKEEEKEKTKDITKTVKNK